MTGRHCYYRNNLAYYLAVGNVWVRVPRAIWFRIRLSGHIRHVSEGQPLVFRSK